MPGRGLFAAFLLFMALLLASDNTKLANNVFYLFLMLPAWLLLARRQLRPTRSGMLLGGYLLYVSISTFWSHSDPEDSLKHLKYVVYILAFAAITRQVMTRPERLKWIAAWGLAISLGIEMHGLYRLTANIGLDAWISTFPRLDQLTGPLNAVYLALAIGLFGFMLISSQVRRPWLASVLVCGLIVLTIPLQSRTPILALLLAQSYYLFRLRAYRTLICWLLMLTAGGLVLLLMIDRFTAEFVRVDIWLNVAATMLDQCSLLLGCGNRFDFNIQAQGFQYANPHSIWLSQLFYGGLLGLALLLTTLWSLCKEQHSLPAFWPPVFLYCAAAGFSIGHSLLTHPDFLWLLTWFPLALSGMLFRPADSIHQAKQQHEADTNTTVAV